MSEREGVIKQLESVHLEREGVKGTREPGAGDGERLLDPDPQRAGLELITIRNPRCAVAESYRDLRTSIGFSNLDSTLKVLLVTSSGPAEGKTTTAANLAVTMAQAGTSTIVVDGDLRRAALDKTFSLPNQFGLTNALFDLGNLEVYIRSIGVERLSALTSGPLPPNPSELLGSQRMRDLLAELRKRFECIIIDSPPVGSVSDALVLSPLVDGVLLVVQAGGFPREMVQRVKAKLDQAQARILGVVLNRVDIEREQPYYYYYQYSSPYYGYPSGQPAAPDPKSDRD